MTDASQRPANRLFRADTPVEAYCAALVARELPDGHNVLAVSSDKSDVGGSSGWNFALRNAAEAFPWSSVVDISGAPLARHVAAGGRRLPRLRDTIRTLSRLDRQLSSAFGCESLRRHRAVDEFYSSLPHHGDVVVLRQLLSSARLYYYPHTFVSLSPTEVVVQAPFFANHHSSLIERGLDVAKQIVLGRELRPIRELRLSGVYTFNRCPPWCSTCTHLGHLLSRDLMRELFDHLPSEVRIRFSKLGAEAGPQCAVLFLSVPGRNRGEPDADELAVYEHLADRVIQSSGAESLVVKPHPRGPRAWSSAVIAQLSAQLAVPVLDASGYAELPAEVLLSPLDVATCIGLASSAIVSFARIHHARALFSASAQRRVWDQQDFSEDLSSAWTELAGDLIELVD